MTTYDAIVLGTGGIGSAALFHLAARGARALGIDRFEPGHDRGSSHGQTRIIRQAYFEHPSYVPMVLRAVELWRQLEARRGEQLYHEVGLLEIGPTDGEVLSGVRASAQLHHLEIEEWPAREVEARWRGFRLPPPLCAVFERRAGYLLVERCVAAHAEEALRLGAEIRTGETVLGWQAVGAGVTVRTDRGEYAAARLIITAGAWAGELLSDLGIRLTVLRKPLYWWQPRSDAYLAGGGCPAFLFEVPSGCFYGFPQIDDQGVKVAEHTGGRAVADPLAVDRQVDPADRSGVARFLGQYLPELTSQPTGHSVCLYTMTPDGHFVVDRHRAHPQVVFAAGLSGHGFKFAPMLGEALCDLALEGHSRLPIDFLSLARPHLR
jgi:sarcosine oxidase